MGPSVLLFYDIVSTVGWHWTLAVPTCLWMYRPTVTVRRHHLWHCWLCSYCHNIALLIPQYSLNAPSFLQVIHSTGIFHESIPQVLSIPCSAFYILPWLTLQSSSLSVDYLLTLTIQNSTRLFFCIQGIESGEHIRAWAKDVQGRATTPTLHSGVYMPDAVAWGGALACQGAMLLLLTSFSC